MLSFFQLILTIKVKLAVKMKQSTYLWVILHVNHKITNYLCFYFIKSKMAAKMATMFGDGTGLQ